MATVEVEAQEGTGYAYMCDSCDAGLWASRRAEATRAARRHAEEHGHPTDVVQIVRRYVPTGEVGD